MTTVSTSVKFTTETAPRDVKELAMIGRFRLKDLAMSIGLGESSENRAALTGMKIEDLAASVAAQLARLDAAGPAPAPAEPAPAPPGTQEAPPAETPKRNPRTRSAPTTAEPTPSTDLAELRGLVDSLCGGVAGIQKQLIQMEAIQATQVTQLKERLDVATALSLLFAEEVLKAGRGDILAQVLEEAPAISDELGKALRGGK